MAFGIKDKRISIFDEPLGNSHGFAFLLTVFVIALASIIVFQIGSLLRLDERSSRAFSEEVQAIFALNSILHLGQVLLEIPKQEGVREDWLGEPWALIGSVPTLPISGLAGISRLSIIDDEGKIDLNAIVSSSSANPPPPSPPGGTAPGFRDSAAFWQDALANIFRRFELGREQYEPKLQRTIGNIAYEASDQVAVIHDWIDKNSESFRLASFPGEGIESGADKTWFYNRPLLNLTETSLIPGMTQERLGLLAPFIHVSPTTSSTAFSVAKKININTAPFEVLAALGFPETQTVEIVQQRTNLPITKEALSTLTQGDNQLIQYLKVTSDEFSIYARVTMPNSVRWLHAIVGVSGTINARRTTLKMLEMY